MRIGDGRALGEFLFGEVWGSSSATFNSFCPHFDHDMGSRGLNPIRFVTIHRGGHA